MVSAGDVRMLHLVSRPTTRSAGAAWAHRVDATPRVVPVWLTGWGNPLDGAGVAHWVGQPPGGAGWLTGWGNPLVVPVWLTGWGNPLGGAGVAPLGGATPWMVPAWST